MSAPLPCRELPESDLPAWEAFVASSPDGSPYALARYLDALCEATGARRRILAVERDGEILGGLPVYERRGPAGLYVAPRLLLYYNGPVLARRETKYPSERTSQQIKVLDALESGLRGRSYAHVRLKPRPTLQDLRPLLARGWSARPSWTYVLQMADPRQAFSRVEGNFRRLIRRCEREGYVLCRDEDFDAFFALHHEIHRRKGVELYLPEAAYRRFYERLAREGLARLYHARDGSGRAVASQLVLAGDHPVAHTVCAGAAADDLRSGASVFLRWSAAAALAEEGFEADDLTDAELNPVTRFKAQLGAELQMALVLEGPSTAAGRLWSRVDAVRRRGRWVLAALRRRLPARGG